MIKIIENNSKIYELKDLKTGDLFRYAYDNNGALYIKTDELSPITHEIGYVSVVTGRLFFGKDAGKVIKLDATLTVEG